MEARRGRDPCRRCGGAARPARPPPGLEHEDPGGTLLGAAAQPEAGAVPREVVDVLVEAGSEIDVPLNLAACFNKADMVGWLLDAGADPAATHIWGITPLQSSAYHGGREAADVLAEALALAAHLGRDAACERLLDRGAEIARAPLYGITALHFAASMGRRSTVALLVARGAPLDCRDGLHGGTPLDWALHNAAPDDELVALLGGTAS